MDNFDAHKWFKKQYLEEGHSLEIDDLEQLKIHTDNLPEDTLSDKAIKRILNSLIKSNIKVDKTTDLSKSSSLIGRMGDRSLREDKLNEIDRDTFNMMEGAVNKETYRKFIDSLDDLLDDWYMEGFEKSNVIDFMEVIIPSN